jgi:hypothetical protein
MLLTWHMCCELHQEVLELDVTVGRTSIFHSRVESHLLLHHLWGPCSQPRQASKAAKFEKVADV